MESWTDRKIIENLHSSADQNKRSKNTVKEDKNI